jgi:hypothetical protein
MKNVVRSANIMLRYAQKAALFLVEHIMADPNLTRVYLLQDMLGTHKKEGGRSFWVGLCNFIRRSRQFESSCLLLRYFKNLPQATQFQMAQHDSSIVEHRLVEQNADHLATSFRGQIIGRLPVLISKCLTENVPIASIEAILATPKFMAPGIDRPAGNDQTDLVYKFIEINNLLLRPFSVVPQSPISDSFITFTESSLLRRLDPKMVFEATGMSLSSKNGSSWLNKDKLALRPTTAQGRFLKFLFGDQLGGRFDCSLIDELGTDRCGRYILRTSFLCDGFSIKCLVIDRQKLAPTELPPSTKTFLEQANELTRRKKPISDPLPQDGEIQKIIGVDFGETFTGGFVCKDLSQYSSGTLRYNVNGILKNLKLKTSALNEPTRMFQNWLNHTKTEVCQSDLIIQTIYARERELERNQNETVLQYFHRWRRLYIQLGRFYNSKMVHTFVILTKCRLKSVNLIFNWLLGGKSHLHLLLFSVWLANVLMKNRMELFYFVLETV